MLKQAKSCAETVSDLFGLDRREVLLSVIRGDSRAFCLHHTTFGNNIEDIFKVTRIVVSGADHRGLFA